MQSRSGAHEPGLHVSFILSFQILYIISILSIFYGLIIQSFLLPLSFYSIKISSFYFYIYTNIFYIFLLPLYLCIVTVIVVVCHSVWTLMYEGGSGIIIIYCVWGELACHKRLFNPPPQFSRLGTWCPTLLCATVLFVSVYGWRMGGGG